MKRAAALEGCGHREIQLDAPIAKLRRSALVNCFWREFNQRAARFFGGWHAPLPFGSLSPPQSMGTEQPSLRNLRAQPKIPSMPA